ncbi:protein phosphatase CheZ [Candidatus Methylomirabilis sp.]|uniref:protein phosphatase CheZ n=1 Tax=Candidatus Methylomirabilis sp. TaxID=2032687 RepID=UPI002A61A15B|nr:protein phosphatase CheZ [Candidatus Methylomirabilis sp.]
MSGDTYNEEQQGDLHELVEAARRMADGKFREIVAVQAKGEIGRLAYYINQTMHNLQQLDPAVGGSSRSLPQMSGQLSEVVKTTEQASMRVLNEIDQMVEEQMAVEKGLRQLATLLEVEQTHDPQRGAALQTLAEIRQRHSRTQGRALEIMSAMEFQDITAQHIQKSIALITEVENRLLRLVVLFNLPPNGQDENEVDGKWKALGEFAAASKSGEMDQEMVDRLLAEFGQKTR